MTIQENIPLTPYTTFNVGGEARYFCAADSTDTLKEAILFAQDNKLKIFILGGGSNILISDAGFPGLVIHMSIQGITEKTLREEVIITAGAGESWDKVVEYAVSKNLAGIENLSGIPGTVGAAPIQNIGAYGVEFKDVAYEVAVFNKKTLEIKNLNKEECRFGYRDSFFKSEEGKNSIVTSVSMKLRKVTSKDISLKLDYKDVKEYITNNKIENPTIENLREAILDIRKKKLPDPAKIGTAGSFFKNPVIARVHFKELQEKFPGLPSFEVDTLHVKIPIAWVLDNVLHLNGHKEGHVGLFQTQPLALVHYGGGTSEEIILLAEKIEKLVKKEIGVTLEREVQYI